MIDTLCDRQCGICEKRSHSHVYQFVVYPLIIFVLQKLEIIIFCTYYWFQDTYNFLNVRKVFSKLQVSLYGSCAPYAFVDVQVGVADGRGC